MANIERNKIIATLKAMIDNTQDFINKNKLLDEKIASFDKKLCRELYESDAEVKMLVNKLEELSDEIQN